MSIQYEMRYGCHPDDFIGYGTARIRKDFLIETIFSKDGIQLYYSMYDRYIAGGIMPVEEEITLVTIDPLKSDYFLERREIGIINVGFPGSVFVDGQWYELHKLEALYIGRGNREVKFQSLNPKEPAKFYINSAPAHHSYPTRKVTLEDAEIADAGEAKTSNARKIIKLIVASVLEVCQLQMGITVLSPGSVWNTMPCHTHDRRMEVYFYFDVEPGQAVCHFMGQPEETRHVWMQNEQAVISPPWSIHSGSGTGSYSFIWGMAGENLDYSDMDMCNPCELR